MKVCHVISEIVTSSGRWYVKTQRRCVAFVGMCVVAGGVLVGCAAGPRARPIPMDPVESGAGSLRAVRQQLAGTWELVSFETFTGPGNGIQVPASGRLTYDEFGHLEIKGQVQRDSADSTADGSSTLLNVSGRALIDAANSRYWVVDLEGDLPDETAFEAVSPENFRYYEFLDDQLKLTVKNSTGRTTATTTWRRVQ